jgi:hypothetical protein
MKAMTGKEYEVVVQTETETLSLKEYKNSLGREEEKNDN